MAPPRSWCQARILEMSAAEPLTHPAMASWCPAMYLVAECRTRSAPRVSGFWLMGDAMVLSMHTRAPFR